jgi:hypothetical protein
MGTQSLRKARCPLRAYAHPYPSECYFWTDIPNELATHALVKSFVRVVLDEIFDQISKMSLPENHEAFEALVFDCLHKPFGVRIAVGIFRRRLYAIHTS